MKVFDIFRVLETLDCMENLCNSGVISKVICARYVRYTRYLEQKKLNAGETHYNLLTDLSIELGVSIQTLYKDIRMMETQIL